MSASLYWHPRGKGKNFNSMMPSRFIDAMRGLFGKEPWSISKEHRAILVGMKAAGLNECDELINALDDNISHGIEVWPEW